MGDKITYLHEEKLYLFTSFSLMQFHVQGQLGGMSCPKTIDLKVDLEKTALIRGNQLIGHSNHP